MRILHLEKTAKLNEVNQFSFNQGGEKEVARYADLLKTANLKCRFFP